MTLIWLGASEAPKAPGDMPFCPVGFNILVTGKPPYKTFILPIKCLHGPITMPDIGFIMTPPLSPLLMGVIVIRLCAGIASISTFTCDGIAVIGKAMFG